MARVGSTVPEIVFSSQEPVTLGLPATTARLVTKFALSEHKVYLENLKTD